MDEVGDELVTLVIGMDSVAGEPKVGFGFSVLREVLIVLRVDVDDGGDLWGESV